MDPGGTRAQLELRTSDVLLDGVHEPQINTDKIRILSVFICGFYDSSISIGGPQHDQAHYEKEDQ